MVRARGRSVARVGWIAMAALLAASPAAGQVGAGSTVPLGERWFAGGGVGLAFGSVDLVEVIPLVGYKFHPRFHAGIQGIYRYRKDSRYVEDVTTNDYGGLVFGRFFVAQGFFLEGDYEHLSYEQIQFDLSTRREAEDNFLAGAGYSSAVGGRTSVYVSVLYNFTFDDSGNASSYDDPWVIRAGVAVGF